jgi:hypothetical protein
MAAQKRAEIEKIDLRLKKLLDSFLDELIDRETYVAEKAKGMSQKKSLEEQSEALLKGRADWLEPFQSWIITARNAGEIAVSGSLQAKRVLALEVFGSNLVLDRKKARGSCVKPWSLLIENSPSGGMEPASGIEPPTYGLRNRCSTTELRWQKRFLSDGRRKNIGHSLWIYEARRQVNFSAGRFGLEMESVSAAPCFRVSRPHPTSRRRRAALPNLRSSQRRRDSADGRLQSVGLRHDAGLGDLGDKLRRVFSRRAAAG